jgi:putative peptide zinc metalloprotease protein
MAQASTPSAAAAEPSPPEGVWAALADRLNPAFERPKLREGIESRLLTNSRGEEYYICKNPQTGTYVRLAPDQYYLLALMDGTRQVKDLVLAYFLQYKSFAFQRVAHVVAELRQHQFLTEEPRDVWGGLNRHFVKKSWLYKVDRLIASFRYHEFPLNGIDGTLGKLYRLFGWLFFTRFMIILWAAVSTIGVALFVQTMLHGRHDPLQLGGSYAAGILVLVPLYLITVSIHELGHALATKHYQREVPRGGMMLYYGMPAFFMDTTDIWMEPRRARMVVSAAGMWAVWGFGGLAMIAATLWPHTPLAPLLFQFAFVAFINNSLNLLPLLELDGYFILMDWLELPLLRARAMAFVRGDLWRKLRGQEPLNREERIFAVFGTLSIAYGVLAIGAAIYFWVHKLQRLVIDAFGSDSFALRALVIVVLVAFGVPFVFGTGIKLWQLGKSARGGVERLLHRREEARVQARLDARALTARLRFLGELSFAQREAIVRHLGLERYRAGDYVVRQGEAGDKFYLIRHGQAEVVQVDAEGWPRDLAVLRRGDTFGELALLYDQPRSASVRALTPLQVYALDRTSFETMVAPELRDRGFTMQRIEERSELQRMPLFRQASPSELDPILDRLRAEEFAPGETIIRQGEPGDRFYLVRRGQVAVSVADGTGERLLTHMGPGEYFGEMALLSDAPRSATVRAVEPTALWSMGKDDFQALVDQFQLRAAISTEAEQREHTRRRLTGERAA